MPAQYDSTTFASSAFGWIERLYDTFVQRYSGFPFVSSSGQLTAREPTNDVEPKAPPETPRDPTEDEGATSKRSDAQTEGRKRTDGVVATSPMGQAWIEPPDADTDSRESAESKRESAAKTTSIVAIVPAYNEADTVAEVVRSAALHVDDVIVIDDNSSDDTVDVANAHADGIISHRRNMGVGAAVSTGYRAAIRNDYDIVVQLDGDGQHDPAYIPLLLEQLYERDADMVIGSRWLNDSYEEYSLVRRAGIRFFTAEVNALTGLSLTDVTSGFRVYRTEALAELGTPSKSHWAIEQTLESARNGHKLGEVSVPMPPEPGGSQFNIETFLKYPPRMLLTTVKILLFR